MQQENDQVLLRSVPLEIKYGKSISDACFIYITPSAHVYMGFVYYESSLSHQAPHVVSAPVHQATHYYREGRYTSCSDCWRDFKTSIAAKMCQNEEDAQVRQGLDRVKALYPETFSPRVFEGVNPQIESPRKGFQVRG